MRTGAIRVRLYPFAPRSLSGTAQVRGCGCGVPEPSGSRQEQPVRLVVLLGDALVAEPTEEVAQLGQVLVRRLEGAEDAPVVGAVVSVVEETDVEATAQGVQELEQRSRPFGELETEEPLVPRAFGPAPDHVAHVQLGHLVVGEVDSRVAAAAQVGGDRGPVATR